QVAISLSDPAIVKYFRDGLLEIVGEGVDIIFCNEGEALNFTQTSTLEAAADALQGFCKSYVITRGAEPTWVYDGQALHQVHAQPVKAIDTNGAGDMFAGAFLAAIDQGKTYIDAAAFANRAAATVVSQFGPRLRTEQYAELKAAL
ncbi:MAG TPA: PfkB family carbohydrate kinase, partial [Marinagarivorans sp.]